MTNYKRFFLPGGTYFFTVNLAQRDKTLLIDYVDDLRKVFAQVKQEQPFNIDAIVILPEHLHAIWTLPEGDSDFSNRWRKIKGGFSKIIPEGERLSESRRSKGERGIWQRRYWEHVIRDELDYARHVDYNPVKHGYCKSVKDWPNSSFHRYVNQGVYTKNWGEGLNFCDFVGWVQPIKSTMVDIKLQRTKKHTPRMRCVFVWLTHQGILFPVELMGCTHPTRAAGK